MCRRGFNRELGSFVQAYESTQLDASLLLLPGNAAVAWHGMTAVARSARGRGVASALKRATIAWASANGIRSLDTANDVDNAPMRAVKGRLGYSPLPDEIYYRGPVAPFVAVPA